MENVLFFSSKKHNLENVYPNYLRERISENAIIIGEISDFSEENLEKNISLLEKTNYIFSTWGMKKFDEDFIKKHFPNLKAIFYGAGTVQAFAREFMHCGVRIFSAWAANAIPVAEFTVSQIILSSKGYFRSLKYGSTDDWKSRKKSNDVFFTGAYGNRIGLLGAGMVGKAVIKLLKNYCFDIYVFDPFLPDEKAAELGVKKVSLDWIFANCEIISNHLANNPQTVGMLNYSLFSKMLPYATFINTGRGATVVEDDLARAMLEEPERIALLDVTNPEPPKEGSALYKAQNIFLSPHIAGSLSHEVERMGLYMVEEFENVIFNKATRYEVSEKMLETMA